MAEIKQEWAADLVKKAVVKQSAEMDSYELINNFVDVDSSGIMNYYNGLSADPWLEIVCGRGSKLHLPFADAATSTLRLFKQRTLGTCLVGRQ